MPLSHYMNLIVIDTIQQPYHTRINSTSIVIKINIVKHMSILKINVVIIIRAHVDIQQYDCFLCGSWLKCSFSICIYHTIWLALPLALMLRCSIAIFSEPPHANINKMNGMLTGRLYKSKQWKSNCWKKNLLHRDYILAVTPRTCAHHPPMAEL